jgi:hypothetical protein
MRLEIVTIWSRFPTRLATNPQVRQAPSASVSPFNPPGGFHAVFTPPLHANGIVADCAKIAQAYR